LKIAICNLIAKLAFNKGECVGEFLYIAYHLRVCMFDIYFKESLLGKGNELYITFFDKPIFGCMN